MVIPSAPRSTTHTLTHTAQTMLLADQAGDKKQLFRASFLLALFMCSEKLV